MRLRGFFFVQRITMTTTTLAMMMMMPRVVPLTVAEARHLVAHSWKHDTQLLRYNVPDSPSLGCIGLRSETGAVTAVALLEMVNNSTIVWDITSADMSSGSCLLRAMCRQRSTTLHFSSALHPRWHIGRMFYAAE